MSRTDVHRPLKFEAPEEDVIYYRAGHWWIRNWRREYDKHFRRIPAEKDLRKRLNKRERTILRDDLRLMRFNPELFEDWTPPHQIDTLWYLM